MPVSPARQLAFDVLTAVDEGGYAADLLHSTWARGLALPDRRLATEKFMKMAKERLGEGRTEEIVDLIFQMETLDNVKPVIEKMVRP